MFCSTAGVALRKMIRERMGIYLQIYGYRMSLLPTSTNPLVKSPQEGGVLARFLFMINLAYNVDKLTNSSL